jgi:hypothetical protein
VGEKGEEREESLALVQATSQYETIGGIRKRK